MACPKCCATVLSSNVHLLCIVMYLINDSLTKWVPYLGLQTMVSTPTTIHMMSIVGSIITTGDHNIELSTSALGKASMLVNRI